MRSRDRMIAARHKYDVLVVGCEGFIETTVVGKDPLNGETLGRGNPVIIRFFEIGLAIAVVGILPVWADNSTSSPRCHRFY